MQQSIPKMSLSEANVKKLETKFSIIRRSDVLRLIDFINGYNCSELCAFWLVYLTSRTWCTSDMISGLLFIDNHPLNRYFNWNCIVKGRLKEEIKEFYTYCCA